MVGMLYSLVALGFVLIFKASGVFNFAQGAMVLFAALTMARFAEWLPRWLHFESAALVERAGDRRRAAVMVALAWVIERLVLRQARQPGGHHAADGHARHHLFPRRASARRCSATTSTRSTSACRRIRSSCSRRPSPAAFWSTRRTSPRRSIAAAAGRRAGAVLPEDRHRPRAARGGRRPPGGAVDRHPAQPHLGHRLERRRLRRAGRRRDLGQQARRAVLAVAGGAEGAAGGDPRRPHLGARRDHRRADHRRRREALRGLHRADFGGGIEIWFAYVLALVFLLVRPQGLFGEKIIDRV